MRIATDQGDRTLCPRGDWDAGTPGGPRSWLGASAFRSLARAGLAPGPELRGPSPGHARALPRLGGALHDVPWAPERRRVRQVQVAHLVHAEPTVEGSRCDVDALGHLGATMAEELHAEKAAGGEIPGGTNPDSMAVGVVGLVIVPLELDGPGSQADRVGFGVPETGAGGDQVEDLDDLGSEAPPEGPGAADGILTRRRSPPWPGSRARSPLGRSLRPPSRCARPPRAPPAARGPWRRWTGRPWGAPRQAVRPA